MKATEQTQGDACFRALHNGYALPGHFTFEEASDILDEARKKQPAGRWWVVHSQHGRRAIRGELAA